MRDIIWAYIKSSWNWIIWAVLVIAALFLAVLGIRKFLYSLLGIIDDKDEQYKELGRREKATEQSERDLEQQESELEKSKQDYYDARDETDRQLEEIKDKFKNKESDKDLPEARKKIESIIGRKLED